MTVKIIALPASEGRLPTMAMPLAATLPCAMAESRPAEGYGQGRKEERHARLGGYRGARAQKVSLAGDNEAYEQAVYALGAGEELEHQHRAELVGILGYHRRASLAGVAHAHRGAYAREQRRKYRAQPREELTVLVQ